MNIRNLFLYESFQSPNTQWITAYVSCTIKKFENENIDDDKYNLEYSNLTLPKPCHITMGRPQETYWNNPTNKSI